MDPMTYVLAVMCIFAGAFIFAANSGKKAEKKIAKHIFRKPKSRKLAASLMPRFRYGMAVGIIIFLFGLELIALNPSLL